MSELELRLHCLALAVQALKEHTDPQLVKVTACSIYDFLAPATIGQGVPHDLANRHPAHPIVQ